MSLLSSCSRHGIDRKHLFLRIALPFLRKYEKELNSRHYALLFEEEGGISFVYLINKRAFCSAVDDNIEIFQKVLGAEVTSEGLLKSIILKKISIEKALRHNHALFGILFGYGTENALLFDRQCKFEALQYAQGCPPWRPYYQQNETSIEDMVLLHEVRKSRLGESRSNVSEETISASDSQKYRDELDNLSKKLSPVGEAALPSTISSSIILPYFAGNIESEETVRLLQKYKDQQEFLKQLLVDDLFVEKIMGKFFEDESHETTN